MSMVSLSRYRMGDVVDEVTAGVGPSWKDYRVVGATRDGIAPAKAEVGKQPERYKLVVPGTVFYNPMRILIGSIAMIREGEPPGITSPDYVVLRTRTDVLDPVYLYFWMRSEFGDRFIKSHARGAVRERLTFARLADGEVHLPPISWQRRFAAAMAEIIRARTAALARLAAGESWDASVLRSAFPVPSPVVGDASQPPHPGDGWQWVRLTDVARLESGHTPSRKHPEWWGGDVPWLALPDIRENDGKVVSRTLENTNEGGLANSSARLLPVDTVALSRTASVGFVTIFGRPMATSQDFVNWVCGDRLRPRFLLHALRASRPHLLEIASGAIHKTIYMNTVELFQICLPPIKVQDQIVALIDGQLGLVDALRPALEAERDAIEQLPARVLAEAFGDAGVEVGELLLAAEGK